MVDKLHNDFRGLISSNDSEDLRAAEAFFARVTSDAVLDGLPRLLGEIDKTISEYKRQVEAWKERFNAALKEGLAAAGCVVIGALIFNILTEVGWGGLGVEASAASAAAVRAVAPVAAAFAGAAEIATAGAVAGAGVFTVEMARTPDPNVARSEGTSFGNSTGEPETPGSGSKLSSSDQRAVDSYEKLISEHESKLEAYPAGPRRTHHRTGVGILGQPRAATRTTRSDPCTCPCLAGRCPASPGPSGGRLTNVDRCCPHQADVRLTLTARENYVPELRLPPGLEDRRENARQIPAAAARSRCRITAHPFKFVARHGDSEGAGDVVAVEVLVSVSHQSRGLEAASLPYRDLKQTANQYSESMPRRKCSSSRLARSRNPRARTSRSS